MIGPVVLSQALLFESLLYKFQITSYLTFYLNINIKIAKLIFTMLDFLP